MTDHTAHDGPGVPHGYPEPTASYADVVARLAELENAIDWMTSCLGCAALLDSCYAETVRAEAAEQSNAALTSELAALRREHDALKARGPLMPSPVPAAVPSHPSHPHQPSSGGVRVGRRDGSIRPSALPDRLHLSCPACPNWTATSTDPGDATDTAGQHDDTRHAGTPTAQITLVPGDAA